MSVIAGGPPEQAAPFRRDRIEWLDHPKQGEPPGVRGEPEPAPLAAGGGENPLPGETVERLREVVSGHAEHTLALAQILHLGNARSAGHVLTPRFAFANRAALGAAVLALGLQLLAAFLPPLAQVLRVGSLSTGQWVTVALLGSTPAVVGQLIKLVRSAGGVHRQS